VSLTKEQWNFYWRLRGMPAGIPDKIGPSRTEPIWLCVLRCVYRMAKEYEDDPSGSFPRLVALYQPFEDKLNLENDPAGAWAHLLSLIKEVDR